LEQSGLTGPSANRISLLRSDADGITQHLAEDAVLMPPHDTKRVGRNTINAWLRGFFEHYTMTDLAMPEREVTMAGDWAIERSLYEWTLRPKDGSAPLQDQANWIGIWRRERDGTWSEACGMWNSTRPLPSATQVGAGTGSRESTF
jgi:ketosteroid isomerase-like protein